jgi:osmotically-inducible protein OsmY
MPQTPLCAMLRSPTSEQRTWLEKVVLNAREPDELRRFARAYDVEAGSGTLRRLRRVDGRNPGGASTYADQRRDAMAKPSDLARRLEAAFEFDRRINSHRFPVRARWSDGALVLEGDAQSVAAKRIAARLAREMAGPDETVVDAARVVPPQTRPDGDMLDTLTRTLLSITELVRCSMRRRHRGELETLRTVAGDDAAGEIEFGIREGEIELDGVVQSLSHRRVVEALAWWIPGCRNVINRLRVEPPEEDNDDELADAVRLVMEIDPSLPAADQLGVNVAFGVVTLGGAVHADAQKQRAEHDAWCVDGVREVLNGIQVRP